MKNIIPKALDFLFSNDMSGSTKGGPIFQQLLTNDELAKNFSQQVDASEGKGERSFTLEVEGKMIKFTRVG